MSLKKKLWEEHIFQEGKIYPFWTPSPDTEMSRIAAIVLMIHFTRKHPYSRNPTFFLKNSPVSSSNVRLPMDELEDHQILFIQNSATGLLHNVVQILICYAFIWQKKPQKTPKDHTFLEFWNIDDWNRLIL